MSLRGITKGTELEETIAKLAKGEAMAAGSYFALSHLAKERGLLDMSETLAKIACDEARHSGLYSLLNGNINEDLFKTLGFIENEEVKASTEISCLADEVAKLGLTEAAEMIRAAAKDEENHGNLVHKLIEDNK